jgi:hypothetical protein
MMGMGYGNPQEEEGGDAKKEALQQLIEWLSHKMMEGEGDMEMEPGDMEEGMEEGMESMGEEMPYDYDEEEEAGSMKESMKEGMEAMGDDEDEDEDELSDDVSSFMKGKRPEAKGASMSVSVTSARKPKRKGKRK